MACGADDAGDAAVHRAQERVAVRRLDQAAGAGAVDQVPAPRPRRPAAPPRRRRARVPDSATTPAACRAPVRRVGAAARSTRTWPPARSPSPAPRPRRRVPRRSPGRSRNGSPAVATISDRTISEVVVAPSVSAAMRLTSAGLSAPSETTGFSRSMAVASDAQRRSVGQRLGGDHDRRRRDRRPARQGCRALRRRADARRR